MANRIFVINGYPQSGKDSFVLACSQFTMVYNISSVDPAKEALKILGWDGGEKTPEVRKALSDLKDLSTRLFDGPVQYCKKKVEFLTKYNKKAFIFIHAREPEELQRYRDELGARIIFIKRYQHEIPNNHADLDVEKFNYNRIIDNTGSLVALEYQAHNFVKGILEEE